MKTKGSSSSLTGQIVFASSQSRTAAFRRNHRVGDEVEGVVLRNLGERQALIEVDGQKMVALLQSFPPEGQKVSLTVAQLHPYIVLKEQTSSASGLNVYI